MFSPPKKPPAENDEIVEQWQLNLPPEAVVGLLQAVCIDCTNAPRTGTVVWNKLWGPKFWSIYFDGWRFRLKPLQNTSHELSGDLSYEWDGLIMPTKFGSTVELRVRTCGAFARIDQSRLTVAAIAAAAAILSVPLVSGLGIVAMIGIPPLVFAWFMIAARWTGTRWVATESFQFLDQVFAPHLVSKQ